jgi:hypothetical protein
MLVVGKKCYARSVKKWLFKNQPHEVVGFFASSSTTVGNDTSTCNNSCVLGRDCSTTSRNDSWDNAHTSDPFNRGERLGEEPSPLVQHTQHMGGSSYG